MQPPATSAQDEMSPTQPMWLIGRKLTHAHGIRTPVAHLVAAAPHQTAMRQQRAFRTPRAAGGVHDERRIAGDDLGAAPRERCLANRLPARQKRRQRQRVCGRRIAAQHDHLAQRHRLRPQAAMSGAKSRSPIRVRVSSSTGSQSPTT